MPASLIGNTIERDDVSKRYTTEDSLKYGLLNQRPESGRWFYVIRAKGAANYRVL